VNGCAQYRDELEAMALRILEPDEEARMRLHLRECVECTQILESYRLAVEHLALGVPVYRAPSRLKGRIMGGLGVRPIFSLASAFQRNRWLTTGVAAAVLVFAVGAFAWAISLSSEVNRLRATNEDLEVLTQLDEQQREALLQLEAALSSARNEQKKLLTTIDEQATLLVVALDPDLIPTELDGTSLAPTASCDYVWSTKQAIGALTCKGLPATSFGATYELWATKGDKTIPVGTFGPREDGTAQLLVKFPQDVPGPVADLYVTLERLSTPPRQTPQGAMILSKSPEQQATGDGSGP
jgi:hypothetical protein